MWEKVARNDQCFIWLSEGAGLGRVLVEYNMKILSDISMFQEWIQSMGAILCLCLCLTNN